MGQIKVAAEASQNAVLLTLSADAVKFLQMSGYTVTAGNGAEYTVTW